MRQALILCGLMQFGVFVMTTSAGIMDHEEARRKKVGGKVRAPARLKGSGCGYCPTCRACLKNPNSISKASPCRKCVVSGMWRVPQSCQHR